MKKLVIVLLVLSSLEVLNIFSQERTVTFFKQGQKESIKAGENVSIAYEGINPENFYIAYEAGFDGDYTLELLENPINQGTKLLLEKLPPTMSIVFSCKDESPRTSSGRIINPNREINFTKMGDTAHVYTCQKVNINYDKKLDLKNVYILYKSEDWGYTLELASKKEFRQLVMDKLCQIYYIANPNLATVFIPENLRGEQVICTPLADGSWELRLGNVNRGCMSRGLSEIDQLRSSIPNYDGGYKIDYSNYRFNKK